MSDTHSTDSKPDALRGLAIPGFTPHTFFSYLIAQALVLLVWWPKGGLFDRIDSVAEPTTLAAVVVFTGVALAWFALQLSADELTNTHTARSALHNHDRESIPALKLLARYGRTHTAQLGYLLVLCTPVTIVAHAISSVAFTQLPWIVAVTAVHTTFYRLLGSWMHLRWVKHDMLATIVSRTALSAIYLTTIFALPDLSHFNVSIQLAQPPVDPDHSPVKTVLIFVATYAALCACVCAGLLHQLSTRAGKQTTASETNH